MRRVSDHNNSPRVRVEEVVLANPEDAGELLVVTGHETSLGSLLSDLKG